MLNEFVQVKGYLGLWQVINQYRDSIVRVAASDGSKTVLVDEADVEVVALPACPKCGGKSKPSELYAVLGLMECTPCDFAYTRKGAAEYQAARRP